MCIYRPGSKVKRLRGGGDRVGYYRDVVGQLLDFHMGIFCLSNIGRELGGDHKRHIFHEGRVSGSDKELLLLLIDGNPPTLFVK